MDNKTFDNMVLEYNKILTKYNQEPTTGNYAALQIIKSVILDECNARERAFYRIFDRQQKRA